MICGCELTTQDNELVAKICGQERFSFEITQPRTHHFKGYFCGVSLYLGATIEFVDLDLPVLKSNSHSLLDVCSAHQESETEENPQDNYPPPTSRVVYPLNCLSEIQVIIFSFMGTNTLGRYLNLKATSLFLGLVLSVRRGIT